MLSLLIGDRAHISTFITLLVSTFGYIALEPFPDKMSNIFEALSNALLLFQLYATRVDEGMGSGEAWGELANTMSLFWILLGGLLMKFRLMIYYWLHLIVWFITGLCTKSEHRTERPVLNNPVESIELLASKQAYKAAQAKHQRIDIGMAQLGDGTAEQAWDEMSSMKHEYERMVTTQAVSAVACDIPVPR